MIWWVGEEEDHRARWRVLNVTFLAVLVQHPDNLALWSTTVLWGSFLIAVEIQSRSFILLSFLLSTQQRMCQSFWICSKKQKSWRNQKRGTKKQARWEVQRAQRIKNLPNDPRNWKRSYEKMQIMKQRQSSFYCWIDFPKTGYPYSTFGYCRGRGMQVDLRSKMVVADCVSRYPRALFLSTVMKPVMRYISNNLLLVSNWKCFHHCYFYFLFALVLLSLLRFIISIVYFYCKSPRMSHPRQGWL